MNNPETPFDLFGLKAANEAQERMARMGRANWVALIAAVLASRRDSILDVKDATNDAVALLNEADERCGAATIVAIKDVLEDGRR